MVRTALFALALLPATALANPAQQCAGFTGQAHGQCVSWFARGCDVNPDKPACANTVNPFPEQLLYTSRPFNVYGWSGGPTDPDFILRVESTICREFVGDEHPVTSAGSYRVDVSNESDFETAAQCLSDDGYFCWGEYVLGHGGGATGDLTAPFQGATITAIEFHVDEYNQAYWYTSQGYDYDEIWGVFTFDIYGIPAN